MGWVVGARVWDGISLLRLDGFGNSLVIPYQRFRVIFQTAADLIFLSLVEGACDCGARAFKEILHLRLISCSRHV